MADIYADFLNDYLPMREKPTVLELGAHRGTDTVRMVSLLKAPFRYVAFEPDPRQMDRLQALAVQHGFTFVPKAVASADVDQAVFWLSGGRREGMTQEHTDSSSLMRPAGITRAYSWMTFRRDVVPVVRLDTFCEGERIGIIDFLWADVQGAELEVIRGGQATFRRVAYFYTECYANGRTYYEGQPTLNEILKALPGRWGVVFQTATDVLLRNKELGRV